MKAKTTGLIKIGRSRKPVKRLANLRSASPDELELIASAPEGSYTEALTHLKFAHLRERGEWFRPDDELLRFIAEVKEARPLVAAVGTRVRTPGQLGAIIHGYRLAAQLTQAELAEKVSVSRQWIVEIERGKTGAEIGLVMQVLGALNIPLGIVAESIEPDLVEQVLRRAKARSMRVGQIAWQATAGGSDGRK